MASMMYGLAAHAAERTDEQRHAVPHREQAHVEKMSLMLVEEEHDADEEQQMVVSGDHVLGAEIHQRADRGGVQRLQEQAIPIRNTMRLGRRGHQEEQRGRHRDACRPPRLRPIPGADTIHDDYAFRDAAARSIGGRVYFR